MFNKIVLGTCNGMNYLALMKTAVKLLYTVHVNFMW